jgi:hypothetical protein
MWGNILTHIGMHHTGTGQIMQHSRQPRPIKVAPADMPNDPSSCRCEEDHGVDSGVAFLLVHSLGPVSAFSFCLYSTFIPGGV